MFSFMNCLPNVSDCLTHKHYKRACFQYCNILRKYVNNSCSWTYHYYRHPLYYFCRCSTLIISFKTWMQNMVTLLHVCGKSIALPQKRMHIWLIEIDHTKTSILRKGDMILCYLPNSFQCFIVRATSGTDCHPHNGGQRLNTCKYGLWPFHV